MTEFMLECNNRFRAETGEVTIKGTCNEGYNFDILEYILNVAEWKRYDTESGYVWISNKLKDGLYLCKMFNKIVAIIDIDESVMLSLGHWNRTVARALSEVKNDNKLATVRLKDVFESNAEMEYYLNTFKEVL